MESTQKIDLGGRPFKLTDEVLLRGAIEKYFNETVEERWTVTGLALALNVDRDTLLNYEKDNQSQSENVPGEVIRLIKRAKLIIENGYELDLKKHGRTGTIFALKNFDWKDKTETEHSGRVTIGDVLNSLKNEQSTGQNMESEQPLQDTE